MAKTISDYRRSKFLSMFQFLDRDHDGFITLQDFGENLTNAERPKNMDDECFNKSRKVFFSWWFLFYDYRHPERNGEKADAAYFVQRCEEYFTRKESESHIVKYYETMFNFIDTNSDGKISVEELAVYYKAHHDESHIKDIFNRLDLDKDGSVTKDEFVHAGKCFWFSDDPKNGFEFLHRVPGLYNIYAP